jgi:hypothetical protein
LKLRLLIFNCGEPGKHTMQLVNEYTKSKKYDPNAAIVKQCAPSLYRESKAVCCGQHGNETLAVARPV